jgi:hypothetical protein
LTRHIPLRAVVVRALKVTRNQNAKRTERNIVISRIRVAIQIKDKFNDKKNKLPGRKSFNKYNQRLSINREDEQSNFRGPILY